MFDSRDDANLLDDLLRKAKAAGADAADGVLLRSASISHAQRLGQVERLEREEGQDLGLRVLIGQRQAVVSSTDLKAEALSELVERAVAMARTVPEGPTCGLAEAEQVAREIPDLDIFDPHEPAPEDLIEAAKRCEEAARAVPGVTNSEGAEAAWGGGHVTLAATNGFQGSYASTHRSLSCSVLAGKGTGMERDYDVSIAVFADGLRPAEEVGRGAGERAVRRLGAKRPGTGKYPVIFDPRVGRSLLGHLAGAINGQAIARGTSFLQDKLGKRIFPEGVTVTDDPRRKRGLASKPFDGEGLPNRAIDFIDDGVLTAWVLDLASARQLSLESNGRAGRGISGPPSPSTSNLYLAPGKVGRADLLAGVEAGFYVTEMMGMGVNGVTGDYSRGAAGFWIENGELADPVSEVTLAGNLKEMFANLTPADDLEFLYGTNAPTLRIDGMTLAGG